MKMSSLIPVECPRLIEVALPIRELSFESVRDKSLRQGHISTLHLWWARRPLAAARAVTFATLVPDPDHPCCPDEFRRAVQLHLVDRVPSILTHRRVGKGFVKESDPYRPYHGVQDTLRNRLLAFIAKWSPKAIEFEAGRDSTAPKPFEMLDDRCLSKWEVTDPDNEQGRAVLQIARALIGAVHNGPPVVLDPFSGGGAIPLEASRLGAQAIANDYNPVAFLLLRATCEYPARYGVPGLPIAAPASQLLGKGAVQAPVPNVLASDVGALAARVVSLAQAECTRFYPTGRDGKPIVGYLWARTIPCANPTCKTQIPMLRSLEVCNLRSGGKRVALVLNRHGTRIDFGIATGKDIKETDGTMIKGGHCRCPACGQTTTVKDVRLSAQSGNMGERMVAVIIETSPGVKGYRPVEPADQEAFNLAARSATAVKPTETMPHFRNINLDLYGLVTWGDIFNGRQLASLQSLVRAIATVSEEVQRESKDAAYTRTLTAYLGLTLGRYLQRMSSVGVWHTGQETFEHPFGRQAIPMVWDYPEANPFSSFAQKVFSSGWITDVITHESPIPGMPRLPAQVFLGDAANLSADIQEVDAVVTDPPYFDAIAYADISDYFYVWLKRSLGDAFPEVFVTPLTPKAEEATALPHRHDGDSEAADEHFQRKLAESLRQARSRIRPGGVVSVMFAHQSTEAWTALVNAVFAAGLTIVGTWPIDTEKTYALKVAQSVLSSSITVACRPRVTGSAASFKEVKKEIAFEVAAAVKRFWAYGFRGADLIVACYGPAVGVFGRHERVEKADGTPVAVGELLELAKASARDAIAGEFKGDSLSTLYYVWANLYGATEQAWDDARLVVQIGGESESAIEVARNHGVFVVEGSSCRLAMLADRSARRGLGMQDSCPLIDALHRAMLLWKQEKRSDLVQFLHERGLSEDGPFWKLAQALFEVLGRDTEDWRLVGALLAERPTLVIEGKRSANQTQLF